MRIVFMGTPDFAVPCLQALLDAGHEVCGVFTQPDKPKGRGYALAPPPVKELALEQGIPVYQPATLRTQEAAELIASLQPEVIVVVAYGKLLPKEVLQIPQHGCINVHASLLPKYRGAAPIQWAVINGDEVTGVATMQMDEGLDTGDILLTEETKISEDETSGELFDRLRELGARVLLETLRQLQAGTLKHRPQGEEGASYASMLSRDLSVIDWSRSAREIHNLVRGLSPWPVASSIYQGKRIKIYQTQVCEDIPGNPGQVLPGKDFLVCCGQNTVLKLITVQYEGGKRMGGSDFLRGHPVSPETQMGF
ncbi:methionyl-tRNA formyltransferase [Faecalispora anaeroviscerum]|uniref:methionyl-tRNA formyltransferase n=1 Tax=Faecalispora anaeroviscerum TaxID=2991836 RepID=UPI0024BB4BC7|nr:methionyl-tRNA formyltransferase [Faecalispora anaeroviscerum]